MLPHRLTGCQLSLLPNAVIIMARCQSLSKDQLQSFLAPQKSQVPTSRLDTPNTVGYDQPHTGSAPFQSLLQQFGLQQGYAPCSSGSMTCCCSIGTRASEWCTTPTQDGWRSTPSSGTYLGSSRPRSCIATAQEHMHARAYERDGIKSCQGGCKGVRACGRLPTTG